MSSDEERVSDEALVAFASGATAATQGQLSDVASELLRRRRFARADSRRAEQVRRLRWATETLLRRVEEVHAKVSTLAAAPEPREDDRG